ncbi:MAG: flagellar hook capping FlgD N-terminal domain-containing protein [Armatimonadota bacterium]|jgi:flagellar basal-body rod modification protein FlgD
MPTTVSSATAAASSGSTSSVVKDRISSDKETFLKLLITQLRNQDPLDPVQDKEFIAQLAQFSSLETLQSIDAKLGASNDGARLQQAAALLGRQVTVADPDASDLVQGRVTSVRLASGGELLVTVNGKDYPVLWLAAVSE